MDGIINTYENWINTVNADDYCIVTGEEEDNTISVNANNVLNEMNKNTEFGEEFKNNIISVINQLIANALKNKVYCNCI
jgi:hypothetical protein